MQRGHCRAWLIVLLGLTLSACQTVPNFFSTGLPTRASLAAAPDLTNPAPTEAVRSFPSPPPTYTPAGQQRPLPVGATPDPAQLPGQTDTAEPSLAPTPATSPSSTPAVSSNTGCSDAGLVVTRNYDSIINDAPIRYRVYLPPCYAVDGRAYPSLYLLHGNDQAETIWEELGLVEMLDRHIRQGILPPFLVVMPEGGWAMQNTSGGPGSFESVILAELLPLVEADYCVWRSGAGRAIGGVSRGGYWALEVAFRNPNQFASVGGHSAALLDTAAGPEVNPQETGISRDLGALRIYLDVGAEDWGSRTNLEQLHLDMETAGVSHEWHLVSGGHDRGYWSANLQSYLDWYGQAWSLDRQSYPICRPTGE